MKKLLSWGGVGLLTGALLDPLVCAGLGDPVPWGRDLFMAAGGVVCLWLMVKYREYL